MNYYITHCDKNFLQHAEKLFETHKLYSNIKCIFFTIDFEYNSKYENVICVPFFSAQHINNKLFDTKAFAVFLKPLITKMVYTLPFINKEDSFCYIDADCLCIENCDNIFNYTNEIIDYPLLNEGCHDFMIMNDRGDPYINNTIDLNLTLEAPLLKLLGYNVNKRSKYLQTGVFLFNYNCLEFLNTWAQTCYDERVLRDWQYLTPFHEETVINCLLWQKQNIKCLNQVLVNIPYYSSEDDDLIKIKHLINELKNPSSEDKFIYTFTKIPAKSKIDNLFFLHGKHSKNVFEFIKNNISNCKINNKYPLVFFTSEKSYSTFAAALYSFSIYCLDKENIIEIIHVDDRSSEQNRKYYENCFLYIFPNIKFTKIYKNESIDYDHAVICEMFRKYIISTNYEYCFILEDDFFFNKYFSLTDFSKILDKNDFTQLILTNNFVNIDNNAKLNFKQFENEDFMINDKNYYFHVFQFLNGFYTWCQVNGYNCFSLNPSLTRIKFFIENGAFDSTNLFELNYNLKNSNKNYNLLSKKEYCWHVGFFKNRI